MDLPKGTFFLQSIDASSHVKEENKIYSSLDDVVEEFEVKYIVQVIIDSSQWCSIVKNMELTKWYPIENKMYLKSM